MPASEDQGKEPQPPQDSRSSRIVMVPRAPLLRILAVSFVLANVVVSTAAPDEPVLNLLLILPLGLVLALLYVQRREPGSMRGWFARAAQNLLDHLRGRPADAVVFVVIVLLACAGGFFIPERFSELFSAILLVIAFQLRRSASPAPGRGKARFGSGFFRMMQADKMRVDSAQDSGQGPEEPIRPIINSDDEERWEYRQQERWEDWMDAEAGRFDGRRAPAKDHDDQAEGEHEDKDQKKE